MKDTEDTKVKVKRIYREKFNGDVYNFHCTPSENYFSHDILVHNCYKSNGGDQPTHNMTFEEFKTIFHKVNEKRVLTQIAFGIMNISTNPDFFKMMEYTKERGVIPNFTCHGIDMTKEIAEKIAKLCGAVAVSIVNKEKSYDAIKLLVNEGMKQINIHYMLSKETYEKAFKIVRDIEIDPKLKGLNAIVFLQYKAKGRNPNKFSSVLDVKKYQRLTSFCEQRKVNYGFDSCSAPIYLASIENHSNREQLEMCVEPCESFGMFSSYINSFGFYFPCSFCEGEEGWKEGFDVLNCDSFVKDIWFSDKISYWRQRMIENKRNCPIFDLKVIRS